MTTTATAPERRDPKTDYSMEEKERCLTAFAMVSRSRKQLAARFEEEGIDVPVSTVRAWADRQHKELFAKIDQEVAEDRLKARRANYAQQADANMEAQDESVTEFLARIRDPKQRAEIKTKELIEAAQKFGIASATATDKERLLGNEPTAIVKRDFEGTLRFLNGLGVDPRDVLEGEASEIPAGLPSPA